MALGKRKTKKLVTLIIALLSFGVAWTSQQPFAEKPRQIVLDNQPGTYQVTEFIDGDTIAVNMDGTVEKIRMIGVDTPETHDPRKSIQCYGEAAANFTKQLIGGNRVRLEADPTNTNRDRYNRLLRYVYLPDQTLVNAEIIKQGYGFAYTYFPFTKIDEFEATEAEAKASNRGLWASCSLQNTKSGQKQTNNL